MFCRHIAWKVVFLSFVLGGCKTSGDIRQGRDPRLADPTGIKTLDGPPGDEADSAPLPEAAQRQLVAVQGELEDLKFQVERERQEWREKHERLEAENKKLQEALDLRASAPEPAAPGAAAETVDKNSAEGLWKLGVAAVQKKADAEALSTFKALLANYPKSKRVWGATLAAGMLEYRAKNYKGAAIYFNQAIDLSAKRSSGPSLAWYFQGLAILKMGKKEDASLFFDELNRRFPRTAVNQKARAIVSGKAKAPNDLFADVPNWLEFMGP